MPVESPAAPHTETITPTGKEILSKLPSGSPSSFDDDFDKGFDDAVKKDTASGQQPPAAKPVAQPDAKPPAKTPEPLPPADVPDALFEPKAPVADDKALAEANEKELADQTKGMSPKAADRFRGIAKQRDEANAALKLERESRTREKTEFEKRLKEAVPTQELESLRKQVSEYEEMVKKHELSQHPRFKAKYDQGIEKAIAEAKAIVGAQHADAVEAIMQRPSSPARNKELDVVYENMTTQERLDLGAAIRQADQLRRERATELENWKANAVHLDDLARQDRQRAEAISKEASEAAYNAVKEQITNPDTGIVLFKTVDGNEDWNSKVADRLGRVRQLASRPATPTHLAELAAASIAAEEFQKLFVSQRVLVKKLQAELASMKGASPSLERNGQATPLPDNDDYATAVSKLALGGGIVR